MSELTCIAPGCDRVIKARGLCNGHYTRLRIHGDIGSEPLRNRAPKAPGAATLAQRLRILSNVDSSSGCWIWQAYCDAAGYGYLTIGGKNRRAHRVSFEEFRGPIPDGLQLDHLCRNRGCINPDHLEAVTADENNRRSHSPSAVNAQKTSCIHGHEFSPENTYITPDGNRACRACVARASRDYKQRRKQHARA